MKPASTPIILIAAILSLAGCGESGSLMPGNDRPPPALNPVNVLVYRATWTVDGISYKVRRETYVMEDGHKLVPQYFVEGLPGSCADKQECLKRIRESENHQERLARIRDADPNADTSTSTPAPSGAAAGQGD